MSPRKILNFMVINGLEVSIPLESYNVSFWTVEISPVNCRIEKCLYSARNYYKYTVVLLKPN